MEPLVVKTNQAIADIIRITTIVICIVIIIGNRLKKEKNISDLGASDMEKSINI